MLIHNFLLPVLHSYTSTKITGVFEYLIFPMTPTSNVCRCIEIYSLFLRYLQKEVIEIEIITVMLTDPLRLDENF